MKGISVCMIVKNEKKWLEQCLDSIKNLADEIIVVDTGSTDKTKEIAAKFTDKIFDYEWNNNFSDARNFALSKATKGWILSLDADESISSLDFEKIKNLAEHPEADGYCFVCRDYHNGAGEIMCKSTKEDIYPESKSADFYSESSRLIFFQNFKGYKFEGKIHETIQNSIRKNDGKIFSTNAIVHHYGALRDIEEILKKKEIYSKMLNERLESKDYKEKEEYYILFELAKELMIKKDMEGAKEAFEKSIALNRDFSKTLSLLGSIKLIEKNLDEAEKLLKRAVDLDSNDSDVHANLGVIYSEQGNFQKAIRKFERAIELNSRDAANFFNLGVVFFRMGKKERAVYFFEKAEELNPAYKEKIRMLNLF